MNDKIRLADAFEQMLSYRKAVGYATATYRSSIPPFISFCAEKYPDAHVVNVYSDSIENDKFIFSLGENCFHIVKGERIPFEFDEMYKEDSASL